jgi:hypothetical protein
MKRARFTEEQIIGVLKEHEAGAKTADLARKHGVSEKQAQIQVCVPTVRPPSRQ